jgi:hypothetical protein
VAVETATRIQKYLSRTWIEDGQEADAVAEISNNVAYAISEWLMALHGPTAKVSEAAAAAKKTILTHCYADESKNIKDMYEEAIGAINDLHNKEAAEDATAKAVAQEAEKDRLKAEREAEREAKKIKKEEEKIKKAALAAKKKLEASQDWDAIISWRPEGREMISLRTMQTNKFTGDDREYYIHYPDLEEAYKVSDVSVRSIYLLSHYDSTGTPNFWEMAISQFDEATNVVTNKAGEQTTYRFYVG